MSDSTVDSVWQQIRQEVRTQAEGEPILASFLHATVLNHDRMEEALSFLLASKLETLSLPSMLVREIVDEMLCQYPAITDCVRADLKAISDRDPASQGLSSPFLYYKGFKALQSYRIAHALWQDNRKALALHLQSRISEVFNVDIHPAAKIGKGVMIDHGTGVVIGETAVVEDDVSMLHEVTLGGTGKVTGDRHPKVGRCVLLGAGAKILGNVRIGEGAKVAACSVVLDDVPPFTTVAGIPAVVVGFASGADPSRDMDQSFPHEHHFDGGGI